MFQFVYLELKTWRNHLPHGVVTSPAVGSSQCKRMDLLRHGRRGRRALLFTLGSAQVTRVCPLLQK